MSSGAASEPSYLQVFGSRTIHLNHVVTAKAVSDSYDSLIAGLRVRVTNTASHGNRVAYIKVLETAALYPRAKSTASKRNEPQATPLKAHGLAPRTSTTRMPRCDRA